MAMTPPSLVSLCIKFVNLFIYLFIYYSCEIWTVDYRLKEKLLSTDFFLEKNCENSQNTKSKKLQTEWE
jgi:hypothetical protein